MRFGILLSLGLIAASHISIINCQLLNRILNTTGIEIQDFDLSQARNGKYITTNLDDMRDLLVVTRHMNLWLANQKLSFLLRNNYENGKMQHRFRRKDKFPCDPQYGRSLQRPNSVHSLRPGDIDIIASFGDSLSAGNGVLSKNIVDILTEYRGITFSGGGMSNWRKYLTLPNILKVFNPQLYGYSTGFGLTVDGSSHLNIAEPMLMSRDLPFQAQVLINRMHLDPNVNMSQHWKLLTIFIGNNDVCSDMCHHDSLSEFVQRHKNDLIKTFRILQENVPRLLVNLVPVPNLLHVLHNMNHLPLMCQAVYRVGCSCLFRYSNTPDKLIAYDQAIQQWQQVEHELSQLPEYNTNDFAVVYQPFSANVYVPTLPNGNTDLRYMASDCFHFSQLGHASIANTLWNSMLQPYWNKSLKFVPAFENIQCPSKEHPYIATYLNS